MSSISVFSKAGLPAVTSLSTALRNLETEVGVTGVAILNGWIQPPKYKLTDAQIDNLMRR